jgi:c-di-GMP-binding flagellar brake protein YcgR
MGFPPCLHPYYGRKIGGKMENLFLKLGDKIELNKKVGLLESETYYSMIYDIIDQQHILIQAPIEAGKIIPLELETIYYACVYSERGLYRGEVEVTKRMKDNNLHYLELSLITPMKKFQRRQYYRMNCILNFKYKDQDIDLWDSGTVLDISGGGLRFSTRNKMEVDSIIHCHLGIKLLQEDFDIYVDGIVLQSKLMEPDKSHYQTRIRFLNMSVDDTETIIKFIFEEERRRRKKEHRL